jgi:hypothetical protein
MRKLWILPRKKWASARQHLTTTFSNKVAEKVIYLRSVTLVFTLAQPPKKALTGDACLWLTFVQFSEYPSKTTLKRGIPDGASLPDKEDNNNAYKEEKADDERSGYCGCRKTSQDCQKTGTGVGKS